LALGPTKVLVDWIRYQRPTESHQFELRYGALVTESGSKPRWHDLGIAGTSEGIDAKLEALEHQLRSRLLPSDKEFCQRAQAVHDALWAPIEKAIQTPVQEVIIVPDSRLNLVSFAALWTGRAFLGQHFRFRYLPAVRELFRSFPTHTVRGPSVVVSDPDFDHEPIGQRATGAVRKMGLAALQFFGLRGSNGVPEAYPRLPGSAAEGGCIAELWRSSGVADVNHLTGKAATKMAVLRFGRPRLLHIATHGQYVEGDQLPLNPMLRSWLALAGANPSLALLSKGEAPNHEDDGILRAEEIREMDLNGTELVALSACDSGIGAIQSGEGVFGLRRSFHEAGSRHLLLTLWPVHDQRTADFVPNFYRGVLAGMDPAASLGVAQARALAETARELGPALAGRLFGGFVLSGA
jgi:CHAT domain-containing protein